MRESRKREIHRTHATAERGFGFEDLDGQTSSREGDGCGETVRAGADDDGVKGQNV